MKINVGCGSDYRNGFVNIDGSSSLKKVDRIINLPKETLLDYFEEKSITYILCNDFIEHHFHWEAVAILKEFYSLLRHGGSIEIRVPDCKYIIKTKRISTENKITMLFGGQDIPQYINKEIDISRKQYPQFFCHKFGWTQESFKKALQKIGFINLSSKRIGTNFVITGVK